MYKKIWIIVFACLIASACGSDNEKNGFIDQSLQVMDGITGLARDGEQVVLGFVSDQGSEYSTTHRTDSDGKIYFKGSSEGQYRTSFSYFRGSGYDNFMEFRLSESDEGGTVVMTVEPPEEKRFASPVVITGIMSDPAGWDQGKTGANVPGATV